jgi:mono/diheme cytochrome c family protein
VAAVGERVRVEPRPLADVGCEACHGPASAHAADPATGPLRARAHREGLKTPNRGTCAACHDPENSVGFQRPGGPARYLERVDHRDVPAAERTVWTPGGQPPR